MFPIASLLDAELPVIQAPMAGVQDEALAIAVSEAGGLGSMPCAMLDRARLEAALQRFATLARPINLNFFCHQMTEPEPAEETRSQQALEPITWNLVSNRPTPAPPDPADRSMPPQSTCLSRFGRAS